MLLRFHSIVFLVCLPTALGQAQSVLDRHIDAVGGKETIQGIKTLVRTAKISVSSSYGEFMGEFEETHDLVNRRSFSVIRVPSYIQKSLVMKDRGWKESPAGVQELNEEELALAQSLAGPSALASLLLTKDSKEFNVEDGAEFESQPCWRVSVENSPFQFFIRERDGLLAGIAGANQSTITFSAYERFNGVQFASQIKISLPSESTVVTYTYSQTKTNVELDDEVFSLKKVNSPDQSNQSEQYLASIDADMDGKISREEAPAELKNSFDYVDTNKDESIDVSELSVAMSYSQPTVTVQPSNDAPVSLETFVASLDRNADGQISLNEASEDLRLYFDKFDSDGNLTIDETELTALEPYLDPAKASQLNNPAGAKIGELFVQYFDGNKDGLVSKSETPEKIRSNLGFFDKNGDGAVNAFEAQALAAYLSEEQLKAMRPNQDSSSGGQVTAKQIISALDSNQNGTLEKSEANDELRPYFDQHDKNGDGAIDEAEARVIANYVNGKMKQSTLTESTPENTQEGKKGGYTASQIVAFLDKNKDGKISLSEASKELKPNFQYIDTNQDGFIDENEAETMVKYANARN